VFPKYILINEPIEEKEDVHIKPSIYNKEEEEDVHIRVYIYYKEQLFLRENYIQILIPLKPRRKCELFEICDMYIIFKQEGLPIRILDIRGKVMRKQEDTTNVEMHPHRPLILCKTQRLVVFSKRSPYMGILDLHDGNFRFFMHEDTPLCIRETPNTAEIDTVYITSDEDIIIAACLDHGNQDYEGKHM
jgi:hypothetical protein